MLNSKSHKEKYRTVISKNTFYFNNPKFQEKYDGYINSLNETLLLLKSQVENRGLRKDIFTKLLSENEHGLRALLALTGFANESLKRLITVVRITNDKKVEEILFVSRWNKEEKGEIREWGDAKINNLIRSNPLLSQSNY